MGDNLLYKVTIQRKKTKLVTNWYISVPTASTSADKEVKQKIWDTHIIGLSKNSTAYR